MEKKMKLRKFQKYASIVPFYSTFLVIIITMASMVRHKASWKLKARFVGIFFGAGLLASLVGALVPSGEHPVLYTVLAGVLLAAANFLFIGIQEACAEDAPAWEPEEKKNSLPKLISSASSPWRWCWPRSRS